MVEAQAGLFVANYGERIRKKLWALVEEGVGDGRAVMVWDAPTEAGYDLRSVGEHRRRPIDMDGLKLVSFHPENEPGLDHVNASRAQDRDSAEPRG
jgi:CRISPR-associated protein Cas2